MHRFKIKPTSYVINHNCLDYIYIFKNLQILFFIKISKIYKIYLFVITSQIYYIYYFRGEEKTYGVNKNNNLTQDYI